MDKRQPDQPIRVLIVEHSRVQRNLLSQLLRSAGGFEVAGGVGDGQEALDAALYLRPDVIVMDVRLPIFDGYTATRQIMQRCPTPIVLMSGAANDLQRRSVEALAAGALAVVRKPRRIHLNNGNGADDVAALLRTLRLMADVPVVTRHAPRSPLPSEQRSALKTSNGRVILPTTQTERQAARAHTSAAAPHSVQVRHSQAAPRVLAIAASTGGPAALQLLLNGLGSGHRSRPERSAGNHPDTIEIRSSPADFPLPILIAQHIARGFVHSLAEWLNRTTQFQIHIADHEQCLLPGHVYLPADGQHLIALRPGIVGLRQTAEPDRYCPSADLLFESVAQAYHDEAIGVILTGMGDDGARGLREIRTSGGYTLAQDAASSIVYGMPQAAVASGGAAQVASLDTMAEIILHTLWLHEGNEGHAGT